MRLNNMEVDEPFICGVDVLLNGRPRREVKIILQLPTGEVSILSGTDAEMFEVSTGLRSVAENRLDAWILHKEVQGTVP